MSLIPILSLLMTTQIMGINYRLPITVIPTYYTVKLVPYFEEKNFTFTGDVEITVTAVINTNTITLHYNSLEILEIPSVKSVDELQELEIMKTSYNNVTDFFTLKLKEMLQSGKQYLIKVKYLGYINENMNGIYRAYYYDSSSTNKTRWMAVSHLSPYHARKVFPCFDEPALKARFQINIARPPDYYSVSNMPLINSSFPDPDFDGRIWDTFEETPPTSSYLIAVAVLDFEKIISNDKKYAVWVRKDALPPGRRLMSMIPPVVKWLETYTGIQNVMPKLDEITVPQFKFQGMENWGLIMFKEKTMIELNDDDKMAEVLVLVAHEISHFWFGNLVTPKWWDHIWLKEGFATYLSYKICSEVMPDLHIKERFILSEFQWALIQDSYITSKAMSHAVNSPEEISRIFGSMSYQKAGSIVRMMEHFLTEETFQRGLRRYLETYSYGTAEPDDLYGILDEEQKKDGILPYDMDVKTIMDSWTLQAGYPIIHVKRVKGGIMISQERFLHNKPDYFNTSTWWVPISYTTSREMDFSDTKPKIWLNGEPEIMLVENILDSEWIILNIQVTGFYRVHYDPLSLYLITRHLNSPHYTDIHVLNRMQFLDDAFNLAQMGLIDFSKVIHLTSYLVKEPNEFVWKTFTENLKAFKETFK